MKTRTVSHPFLAGTIGVILSLVLAVPTAQTQASHKSSHRNVHFPVVGHEVRTLPRGSRSIQVGKKNYRYHNGSFYRAAHDGRYVVVRAPIGARVSALPPGFVRFSIGARNYFYANLAYYLWDSSRKEYIVVEEPAGAKAAMAGSSETVSSEEFVYPNEGQSDEQRARDRFECYRWAVDESGFDPADGATASGNAGDYQRANSACLEGRGYTVK